MKHIDMLVNEKSDILKNVQTFYEYGNTNKASPHRQFFDQMIKDGRNFVVSIINNKLVFANSKFVGYKNNNFNQYLNRVKKRDGRKTSPRIQSILHNKLTPSIDPTKFNKLLSIYNNYSIEKNVHPDANTSCFWVLDTNVFEFIGKPPILQNESVIIAQTEVIDLQNNALDSVASLDFFEENYYGLILDSRGGERNSEYDIALHAILTRLKEIEAKNLRFYVASNNKTYNSMDERSLSVNENQIISFKNISIKFAKNELRKNMIISGQSKGSKGGNSNKRILIQSELTFSQWQFVLFGEQNSKIPNIIDIHLPSSEFENSEIDARQKMLRSISERRGQPKFRRELLAAYSYKCAVTGTSANEVLEAAHILPYINESRNHVQNGILLRADIHTLFDRFLLSIDEDYKIVISEKIMKSYGKYHGMQMNLPIKPYQPNKNTLSVHYSQFKKKVNQ